jgi:nucleotide-binding universal stress UspA family protein
MPNRTPQAQRVFLVVVDESPELKIALRFACNRARHVGGRVAMLYVTEPAEGGEWMGVGELMREERRQAAETKLAELSSVVHEMSGETPMLYVREGEPREALLALLEEEPAISILVLGAGTGRGGPGPLVTELAGKYAGQLRVPLTIVPGSLTDDDIDAIS